MNETWLLNEQQADTSKSIYATFTVDFTSNGQAFDRLSQDTSGTGIKAGSFIYYTSGKVVTTAYDSGWTNTAYRTIVLSEPASGEFLKWLTANAVKQ